MPVSYAAFAFFLTPTFVLAWLPLLRGLATGPRCASPTPSPAPSSLSPPCPSSFPPMSATAPRSSCAPASAPTAATCASWPSPGEAAPPPRASSPMPAAPRTRPQRHRRILERLLAETWPRRRPFAQFATAFVTYLRRFAQGITTLAALEGEWDWKQSGPVQSRLELLDRRLEWLEEQTSPTAHAPLPSSLNPWPDPALQALQPPVPPESHPGERQLGQLERRAEILRRQLKSLRDHGWLPGVPQLERDSADCWQARLQVLCPAAIFAFPCPIPARFRSDNFLIPGIFPADENKLPRKIVCTSRQVASGSIFRNRVEPRERSASRRRKAGRSLLLLPYSCSEPLPRSHLCSLSAPSASHRTRVRWAQRGIEPRR